MTTLSLSMIVRNEEKHIARVLSIAMAFCDELIVVDTGSTDRTVEIAERMGAKVFHFAWTDNFAAARNYSWDCCTGDWIIWLDADDVITPECQSKLKVLKQKFLEESLSNTALNAVSMQYRYSFDAQDNCTLTNIRERIFRRLSGCRWEYPVHEIVHFPYGSLLYNPDIWIEHRPLGEAPSHRQGQNLGILAKAIASGNEQPRVMYNYARELHRYGHYGQSIEFFAKFLLTHPYSRWEKYDALLNMALCQNQLNNQGESRKLLFRAIEVDSRRAEAYNELGFLHYHRQEWDLAIPYFRAATLCQKPPGEDLIRDEHYNWMCHEALAICYGNVKEFSLAIPAMLKSLPYHPDRENMKKNLRWFVEEL